jgi:rfaE bifunctional protein kinase chain/domain
MRWDEIENALLELVDKKVLIIGDSMLDHYVMGDTHRISPEAPVPIIHRVSEEERLGGAANVALNIKSLGSHPFLCTMIGVDNEARRFKSLMAANDLPTDFVASINDRQTTVKTRIIAQNQHILRIDREETAYLHEAEEIQFLEMIKAAVDEIEPDIILLQDYNKGLLTKNVILNILRIANKREIFTAVDPKSEHFFDFKGVDLFKPNLKEISAALGKNIRPIEAELIPAAQFIENELDNKSTIITLSEAGLYIKQQENTGHIVPTEGKHVADVSGAGDTVLAVAALLLHAEVEDDICGMVCNICGSIVCGKVGVSPVDLEEIRKHVRGDIIYEL